MIDSTLAFLRGDETGEESRTIDIASMLKTICDHLSDAGHDVVLTGVPRRCTASRWRSSGRSRT